MQDKLQSAKKKVRRHAPKVVALAGAAVTGAVLMSRHIDYNAQLLTVNTAITAHLRNTGEVLIFETLQHGSFALAPVVQQ